METRKLGASGPVVSVVGLGCNNFGARLAETESIEVVRAALDSGITHFDTAESYGRGLSEEILGKGLGIRRADVIVATKFDRRPAGEPYRPGILRERILKGCEGSLRRLNTDYIDIYYQHHPDPEAPLEEALETLAELLDAGKIRYAACSNYSGQQIDEAAALSQPPSRVRAMPVACQVHWSLLFRDAEREQIPAALRHHIGVVPYFPLESGLLTGKYRKGQGIPAGARLEGMGERSPLNTPGVIEAVEELIGFAEQRGHTVLELAFAWLLAQNGVASVISGATNPVQVAANVAAGNAWRLTGADLAAVPVPSVG